MIKIQDILDVVEGLAPLSLQESWDNSGVQVGYDLESECTGALLALDVTYEALEKAKELGFNLIITHHPLLFNGIKSLSNSSIEGRIIGEAIQHGITIYSSHTAMDSCLGGLNDYLAKGLKLSSVEVLEPSVIDPQAGLGRVGVLPSEVDAETLALEIKGLLNLKRVNFMDSGNKISTIALCTGSGASLMPNVLKSGVDAYLTGDLKYSNYQNIAQKGLSLFDIGHYESEICVIDILEAEISKKFTTFATHKFRYNYIKTI